MLATDSRKATKASGSDTLKTALTGRVASCGSSTLIWTRLKRVGTSRRSLFQEELGYIEGGSETLVTALCTAIELTTSWSINAGYEHLWTPALRTTFYGGYAAYFTDPDGHSWEIAYNPGFPIAADGSITVPDFAAQ